MFPLKALEEYLFYSLFLFLLLRTIPDSPLACRYTTPASACLHTASPLCLSVSSPEWPRAHLTPIDSPLDAILDWEPYSSMIWSDLDYICEDSISKSHCIHRHWRLRCQYISGAGHSSSHSRQLLLLICLGGVLQGMQDLGSLTRDWTQAPLQ